MQIFHFILFYRINYVWSILFYQVKDHNVLSFSDNLTYIYISSYRFQEKIYSG